MTTSPQTASSPVPDPGWVEHVMWWHVYPLGFVGADIRPEDSGEQPVQHRFGRIEKWLDHLVELGLNGLQLGPVFASATHGYDTVDYFRIDPRLGDNTDFDHLITASHDRGIRVLLDGVFNHVSRTHPAFTAVTEHGPAADTVDLFQVDWDGWQLGEPVPAEVFEGHDTLVTLNHDSPAVENLVVDVMTHWLGRGIDGWRLDAAYTVPVTFWSRVLPRVRERFPDAWFTAEVIHGDTARFVEESTVNSVTQYELWQGVWHCLQDQNFFELAHTLERHNTLQETFVPSTFLGNHDVTRIATAIGDTRHLAHALAVLFTVAGTPGVYAGDEYGYEALKEDRIGGDDAVRPTFPDMPPAVGSLTEQAQESFRVHETLIALRRRHPWLHQAHTDITHVTKTTMALRTATSTDTILTVLNLDDEPVSIPAADATETEAGDASILNGNATVPGHGWAVLSS